MDTYYTKIYLKDVEQRISELCSSPEINDEELEFAILGCLSSLAIAWHLRDLSDTEFESMSDDDDRWIERAIPNLDIFRPFFIVPPEERVSSRGR